MVVIDFFPMGSASERRCRDHASAVKIAKVWDSIPRRATAVAKPSGDYELIDLFCGSGAFGYGMRLAGLTGRALMVDSAEDCAETCLLNHHDTEVLCTDVRDIDWSPVRTRIVVGGPPCQGFSTLGRQLTDDPRNSLYEALLRCVENTGPDFVVVENVPRFLDVAQGAALLSGLRDLGFEVRAGVLDAAAYGVPQRRRRAIVSAARSGIPIAWPDAGFGPGRTPFRTVADAFAMLPHVPDGRNWHVATVLSTAYTERARAIPPGGSRLDLPADLSLPCWHKARGHSDVMGRLRWSAPATTIRTEFHRPEKGRFLHPSEDRSISIREAARLQSFPDSYRFPENLPLYTVARQIGNAIPVALARAIGDCLSRATERAQIRQ